MKSLTRRDFLKSMGLAALGAPLGGHLAGDPPPATPTPQFPVNGPVTHWDGSPLGRILLNVMTIYVAPSWRARAVAGKRYYYGDVIGVEEAVGGEGLYANNHTWLRTADGYIYSSWVQPVNYIDINPVSQIGEGGVWAQVTLPSTWARGEPHDESWRQERLMYSTVHRVFRTEGDYYYCEEVYGGRYFVKAAHLRIIPPEEIAPLSPEVEPEAKSLRVSIRDQMLRAYEGDVVVKELRVSTGMPETPTGAGEYRVLDKRLGQRMTGGLGAGAYNLPGIPAIAYFSRSWMATHGCYWHNDYGRRHSNGCINLLPADALWVFRWTNPVFNYWAYSTPADGAGTRITVSWA